jgi:hypothetical protein
LLVSSLIAQEVASPTATERAPVRDSSMRRLPLRLIVQSMKSHTLQLLVRGQLVWACFFLWSRLRSSNMMVSDLSCVRWGRLWTLNGYALFTVSRRCADCTHNHSHLASWFSEWRCLRDGLAGRLEHRESRPSTGYPRPAGEVGPHLRAPDGGAA